MVFASAWNRIDHNAQSALLRIKNLVNLISIENVFDFICVCVCVFLAASANPLERHCLLFPWQKACSVRTVLSIIG